MERKAGTAVKPGETELARQLEYIRAIRAENDAFAAENGRKKKFYSLAMGCQMNAHDSEKLEGMLDEMGFDRTDEETEADFIIYNTCCVRENAEQKVYGKLGWLKHYKETKKSRCGDCALRLHDAAGNGFADPAAEISPCGYRLRHI